MSYYQKLIHEATGCDPETCERLEEIMRNDIFHSTLDWQSKEQLVQAAKEAVVIDIEMQKILN